MKKTIAKKESPAKEGNKAIASDLPKGIFNVPMNANLVHQIITSQLANRRQNIAHAKSRAEVSGGGIKPWRQKGTGRARHGSIRSPLWIGGGVALGPRNDKILSKTIPQKMKRKALMMVLSSKAQDGYLVLLEEIKIDEPKTKKAIEFLNKNSINGESCLIALSKMDKNIILAMRNIPRVETIQAKDLNCLDLLSHRYLILDKKGIEEIKKTFKRGE
ncbi:MAG: 50S ribosomal protein L4 [Candidatus Paceibacterota bacterium]|jgi:large subunit ribosomal protein L4